jgi:hypothetical protein
MGVAHHLLSQWPALDASTKQTRLSGTLRISPGPLVDALTAGAHTVEAAARGLWRRDPSVWSDDRPGRRRRVVDARQRRSLMAARIDSTSPRIRSGARSLAAVRGGFGRGTLDVTRSDRPRAAGAGSSRVIVHTIPLATGQSIRRACAGCLATTVRQPQGANPRGVKLP